MGVVTEHIKGAIAEIGEEKVISLVTDDAPNMNLARRLVVQTAGFMHILQFRCFMHAFSLLIGSILGHVWAVNVIKKAQRIVTYVR